MRAQPRVPVVPLPAPRRPPRSLREARVALLGLSAVFLVEMLDNAVLTVALPTIGRELHASAATLQLVTSSYAVVFGGLMLTLSALADRVGRRRVMLAGLVLLAAAALATGAVTTIWQLVAVRAVMGVAAAMTTPGSLALAFRLFDADELRVRATTVISTVGLVGLALGPTVGGLLLAVAPWQALLIVNAPVAALAFVCIRRGVAADALADLHRSPADAPAGVLGTAAVVLALVAPVLFTEAGAPAWLPWAVTGGALAAAAAFVVRERSTPHPLLDLRLVAHPLVSSGLAFKAATGLATAGLGFLVTLQLQLAWGWSPARAAVGTLPQVVVLIGGGFLIRPVMRRLGLERAASLSALTVVLGLLTYVVLGGRGYAWVALALVLVAAGMRVNGVVAGTNVMRGLPADRTTTGAALADTAAQVATAAGVAVGGTFLAALVTGDVSAGAWTPQQVAQFGGVVHAAGGTLTLVAGVLVTVGLVRARQGSAGG
ncbi:MFS transporter [Cellulomonas sp. ES6]|uniref:MFS transporter n=1 Tax=Cellulomonas sp. ES6 TaxID=3039384 RepID=UPI0024B6FDAC|nr:MFS transporter [Cellulomonas sp. ES6]WHP17879.1 MFS transporter [Cellulomonas sp. ES6]